MRRTNLLITSRSLSSQQMVPWHVSSRGCSSSQCQHACPHGHTLIIISHTLILRDTPAFKLGLTRGNGAHLLVHLGQQLEQLQLALVRQGGEVVLVDEGTQIGVDQDGVGCLHVDLAPAALHLPWDDGITRSESAHQTETYISFVFPCLKHFIPNHCLFLSNSHTQKWQTNDINLMQRNTERQYLHVLA